MKKTLHVAVGPVLAFMILFSVLSAGAMLFKPISARAESGKTIDVYLIGGQSNAAGYSPKGSLSETFENVYYAGQINKTRVDNVYGTNQKGHTDQDNLLTEQKVTSGLGKSANHIGPEYGMAKVLNGLYSLDSPALIFKSAAGGTALRNVTSGESAYYGNWYPRSQWQTAVDANRSAMGVQYHNFVENFKIVYNRLTQDGYTVHVKGMAWMQGETDLGNANSYKKLLPALIDDLRSDLHSITGDDAVHDMPFVIGEIATTVGSYNNPNVPSFIAAQREIAVAQSNVYAFKTDDLVIVDSQGNYAAGDEWHFGTADAVMLGERFGRALAVAAGKDTTTALGSFSSGELPQCEHGKVSYAVSPDQSTVTLTATPDSGYKLSRFSVDGTSVIRAMTDNAYTTTWRKNLQVSATFSALPVVKYTFTVRVDEEKGSVTLSSASVSEGSALYVTVSPKDGYETESVTFGDTALGYDEENGRYVLENVSASGEIAVTFKEKTADSHESGCGSATDATELRFACILFVGACAAAAIAALCRRKRMHS